MKPSELYQRNPVKVDHDISILQGCSYDHIQEVHYHADTYFAHDLKGLDIPGIEIRYYQDFYFDHRRFWRLASVWWKGNPVMIIQNAGREGDDYFGRFITNAEAFDEMTTAIRETIARKPIPVDRSIVVSPEMEIESLTEFYGNKLDGYFSRYNYL